MTPEMSERYVVSGQVRLGDADLTYFPVQKIIDKIIAAKQLAGMTRVLFLPSHNPDVNRFILDACRTEGLEVYLWYKVLADNDIMPDRNDLIEDAWGERGTGRSGLWTPILTLDESHTFACANNYRYNKLPRTKCAQLLKDYDGLFLDAFGFPLPSLGLEMIYSCFCPYCMEKEPRLAEWREVVHSFRETVVSATDAILDTWSGFADAETYVSKVDFFQFRYDSITRLVAGYRDLAKKQGKPFALDVVAPSLRAFAAHNYPDLGELADWIKPRVYSRYFGPSGLPLELHCYAKGLAAWGTRLSAPAILRYIGRSTGMRMPENVLALDENAIPDEYVASEIAKARELTAAPVHAGLEFFMHPELGSSLTESNVRNYVAMSRDLPGLVIGWNLLYVPDEYLGIIGQGRV